MEQSFLNKLINVNYLDNDNKFICLKIGDNPNS